MFHAEADKLRRMCNGPLAGCGVAHGQHTHLCRHSVEVTDPFRDRMVSECPPQGRGNRNLCRWLVGHRRCAGIEQDLVDRGQFPEEAQECDQLCRRRLPDGSLKQLGLDLGSARKETALLPARETTQDIRSHFPRAWGWPGVHVGRRVRIMEKRRLEAQKGDDLRSNPRLDGPFAPVQEVRLKIEMDEAVPQRSWHREMDASLRGGIAGGDHDPTIRESVLAELPVKNQLGATSLGHLRRRSQLVEKQNALPTVREEFRRHPFRAIGGNSWEAAQVDRIELHRPDVEELAFPVGGDLSNNLRLPDAARAPDMQGYTFADQRMKRLVEF